MPKRPVCARCVVRLFLALTAFFPGGCIAVVPHEPNVSLVDARGLAEVRGLTSEVLTRASNRPITIVDITESYLQYSWNESYLGPFYNVITAHNENRIYFANVARVEIYENNNVFIWGPRDQRVDKILFLNAEDARLFTDCLLSLREARKAPSQSR